MEHNMPVSKIDSRCLSVDTEKCIKHTNDNKFNLVLVAAARAKEMRRHNSGLNYAMHTGAVVTALLEVQEGKINSDEYLRKLRFK